MHKNTVCILRLHIFKLELGLGLGLWSLMPLHIMEETSENHLSAASHWKGLSPNVVSNAPNSQR
jgi:hypothetical protein